MSPDHPSDLLTRTLHAIAGIALCVMMLVVVGDVVLRAVFNLPVRGAYDVVGIALLVMGMAGMTPVVVQKSEIVIDLIDTVVPSSVLTALKRIAALLGLGLFVFFGWSMIQPAHEAWQWGERSLELGLPKWPLWIVVFLGLVGIFWGYMRQLISTFQNTENSEADQEPNQDEDKT